MLELFRRFQSYIYVVVAFVIIISFSFFGTYNTLPADSLHEQIAFTAIDGSKIKRSELEETALFIATDSDDKLLFGGIWGPNFLNDGVLTKDFLDTGLAEILMNSYVPEVASDLETAHAREKHYSLYVHPEGKFISTDSIWQYFAPQMKKDFAFLNSAENVTSPDAIQARINLFLGERQLPAPFLRQLLRYQQSQYTWMKPDPNLENMDLSLYGHHTFEDWFGQRTLCLIAQFIINSSKIAEQKGYEVTKAEALADLMQNSEHSYQQNLRNPNIGVRNAQEYFSEQLRRQGIDANRAAKIWRQVLLFRRLFNDVGNSNLMDPLIHKQFYAYAKEAVVGDLYRLPPEFRFSDYSDMQKFEIYLDAVSKRDKTDLLALPDATLGLEEVKAQTPQLVQRRYVLDVAQMSKNQLIAKVGLKEMWEWESADKNWDKLKSQFPELGLKNARTKDERLAALDNLDANSRTKLDMMARKAVVENHPEWIQEALANAKVERLDIGISQGGTIFVKGLKDYSKFVQLLDLASTQESAKQQLEVFTADGLNYYTINVIERAPEETIMTFNDADETLDLLLTQKLEAYYPTIQEQYPALFKQENRWRPFADVREKVADLYFKPLLDAIRSDYTATTGKPGDRLLGSRIAPYRLYKYARTAHSQLKEGSNTPFVKPSEQAAMTLADQWKWEKSDFKAERSSETQDINKADLFALQPSAWTLVYTPPNGDLYFFFLKTKEQDLNDIDFANKVLDGQQLIADSAQRNYMHELVRQLKNKNAISLDYLKMKENAE